MPSTAMCQLARPPGCTKPAQRCARCCRQTLSRSRLHGLFWRALSLLSLAAHATELLACIVVSPLSLAPMLQIRRWACTLHAHALLLHHFGQPAVRATFQIPQAKHFLSGPWDLTVGCDLEYYEGDEKM